MDRSREKAYSQSDRLAHQHSCIFGAVSIEGNKQLFTDSTINSTVRHFLIPKENTYQISKMLSFLDKASPHYKSNRVIKYFEENKDTLIPVYLPTASTEFMVMEEVWNIAKRDLFVLQYYPSFEDFKNKIAIYFRTKRFNLNMRNYLLRDVW
ncbi:MAG: transposase [Candidatus Nitrosocosmicus sp.]